MSVRRGERLGRALSVMVMLGGGFLGAAGFGAPPAFAATRVGTVSPNGAGADLQFTAGSQTGTVSVQGLAGQQLTIATSAGTFTSNCGLQLSLLSPTGTTVSGPACAGQTGSVSSASLPSDGLYKASLVGAAGAKGNVTVTATSSGGPASITPGAAALTTSITTAGQDARLGFTAAAGKKLAVTTASGTLPDCNLSLRFLNANGTPAGPSVDACAGSSGFAELAGTKKATYFVQLLHNGTAETGTVAVTLSAVTDLTGTVTTDGTVSPVGISSPGQNEAFTFSGTSGQRVAAELSGSTFGPACPSLALSFVRPDGTVLGVPASGCGDSVFLDTQALDQTGTWTLLVDPQAGDTGTASLQAFTSTDQSGVILRNGSQVPISLTTPGQNARFTFTGTVGQQVSALLTNSAFTPGCPEVALTFVRPDLSQAGTVSTCTDTAFLDTVSIDQAGTWTVLVDPQAGATGTATLQAFNAADQLGAITLDSTPVAVNLTTPGQDARLHFSGTVGMKINASVTSATFPGCTAFTLALVRPDGSVLGSVDSCTATANLSSLTLDQAGTWNLLVDPAGTGTGTATLQATNVGDQVHAITLSGAAVNVNITQPGQGGSYTFSGTTGQKVAAQMSASTFTGCPAYHLSLVRPDSTTLGTGVDGCGATGFLDAQTLDQTGTWTIHLTPAASGTGTAKLNAYDSSDQVRPITINGPTVNVNITQPGENGSFTFSGTSGQGISAQVTVATFGNAICPSYELSLVRPDGSQFGDVASSCTDTLLLNTQTLDQDGTWSIVVDPQGTTKGKAKLQAFEDADQVLPITLNGAQVPVSLGPGQQGHYTFTGATGQQISAQVFNSTFPGCTAYVMVLHRPDQSQLGPEVDGCGASAFLDSITLDQNGTWEFVIQPQGGVGGTAALQAYTFSDQTGAADLTGKATKLVLAKPGQNAMYTFSGTTGQSISAWVSQSTVTGCPSVALSLVRPDGTVRSGPFGNCTDNVFLDTVKLDKTGTWTVLVDPQGAGTGLANLQVYNVVDVSPAIKVNGPLKSFTTTVRGTNAHLRFDGKVGDSRTVTITGSTYTAACPGLVVSFVRPDGSVLSTTSTCNSTLTLGPSVLDAAGTWTILIDPQGPAEGTSVIKLT